MKNGVCVRIIFPLLAAFFLVSADPLIRSARAIDVVWSDPSQLVPIPGQEELALYPSGSYEGNTVTVNGLPKLEGGVLGAITAEDEPVSNNEVIIKAGTVIGIISGGISEYGPVSGNIVTIAGGDLSTLDNDGDSENDISGGISESSDSKGNQVNISGGSIHYYDDLFGGVAEDGEASGNKLAISGGVVLVNGSIIGGSVFNGNSVNNSVIISGGRVGHEGPSSTNIVGGEAYGEDNASASGNELIISDGSVAVSNIVGGFVGQNSTSKGVSGNSVVISGGSVDSNIFGGFDQSDGNAVNNTVTLSGSPTFNIEKFIRGGRVINGSDSFSGNTLNVWNYSGSSVGNVINFEYFDFVLSSSLSKNETVLKVDGTVYLNDKTAADSIANKGSQITGISIGENVNIKVGDTIVLIQADTLDTANFSQDGQTITTKAEENGAEAEWSLTVDVESSPNQLTATLLKLSTAEYSSSGGGCNTGIDGFLAIGVFLLLYKMKNYFCR
jgi:hypothetical protein